ncbi:MAG: M3 family peptidase [Sphingobacteriia bacterium]|nr:M3 family peptidase [Sphingobacteriia bacterium]
MTIAQNNPLLGSFNTPHQTAPFGEIKNEHFIPAFQEAIKQGEAEIEFIAGDLGKPTFENTIAALDHSGRLLSRTAGIFFNLMSAETSDELQKIAQEVSPMLIKFQNDINLNPKLFERVNYLYFNRMNLNLNPEQVTMLENTYTNFVQKGAKLKEDQKERYREISTELAKLSLTFDENVLKETNSYELHVTDKTKLGGLPEGVLEAAATLAKEKKKTGWVFTLDMPSYLPFMKYADNRDLRKDMYIAYGSKAFKGNEFDNQQNVERIAELRMEMAKLLGYKNYAEYALVQRMATNPENVYKLLDDLYQASFDKAKAEKAEVQAYAEKSGFAGEIMPWDWNYYSEKLKVEKFSLNDEMLKPDFELKKVIDGVFGLATDLYGITFKPAPQIPVYNKEVVPYEVFNADGSFLAVLYTDFHPREGKRSGAWMTEYKGQEKDAKGRDSRPHITVVMNFTRPTASKPALLTYDEVETFLHEFGHALHGMLADGTYASLSGTNVYRDFVELPSQIMENWAQEKDFLDGFVVHYQTGEKIPANLVQQIKDAANFNCAYACLRQLTFGFQDMAFHTITKPFEGNVIDFENAVTQSATLLPHIVGTGRCTTFTHIFSGGYAAGYYGYKWAEVLDADAFSLFKQNGIFDHATATSFKENILMKGGSEHPMVLYKRFRGQEPTVDALLKRNGIQ